MFAQGREASILDALCGGGTDDGMASMVRSVCAEDNVSAMVRAYAGDASVAMVRAVAADVPSRPLSTGSLRFVTNAYRVEQYRQMPLQTYGTGPAMQWGSPEWGRITSGFGYRAKFGRMHKGIDIAMNVGDTVKVPLAGFVKRTGYEPRGYGHYVVVGHPDGMETRYAHLSRVFVMCGDRLEAGDAMGLAGNTGNSTGPHLHFETRLDGNAVNPLQMGMGLTPVTRGKKQKERPGQ